MNSTIFDLIIPALCFEILCFDGLDVEPVCFDLPCPLENQENEHYRRNKQQLDDLKVQIKGQEFYVTTLNNGGLSGFTETISFHNETVVNGIGVAFELFNILRDKYEFNYKVVKPELNRWGSENTGVLGMMVKKQVNITVAFLPVLADYYNHTTYSPFLDMGVWLALMRRPQVSATGTGLLAPFTLPVWMLILLSLFVVGPIIHLMTRLKTWLCQEQHDTVYDLSSCMWFVYGAILKQGTTLDPVTDSSRILFATWWIFITILTAFYTANLTAFLTLSKFTLPINSPEDIGKGHYSWLSNEANGIRDIITSENNAAHKSMALGNIIGEATAYVARHDDYILEKYLQSNRLIFIREQPLMDYAMYNVYKRKAKRDIVDEEGKCIFVVTKFNIITTYPRGFAYAKDFKYQQLFDSAIQQLVESGIIDYKLNLPLPDVEICPLDLGTKERQLLNSDLLLTYIIVGVGFGIAAAVFVIELSIKYLILKEDTQLGSKLFERKKVLNQDTQLNSTRWEECHFPSNFKTPPPNYNSVFKENPNGKNTIVNGREYRLEVTNMGQRLVPVRTPSALLFQYTN